MQCPSCSAENSDSQKFCGQCGGKLPQERNCPACGNVNPLGNRFCGECGTAMAAPQASAGPANPQGSTAVASQATQQRRFQTGGERRQVAVLFADVVGFTAMSEKMDPERVTDIMNRCFEKLEKIILKYEGTIDKYMGDSVLAVFGAPVSHENDVERAVHAALEMRDVIKVVEAEVQVPLNLTIGVTAGEVIAGDVGGSESKSYTVMGDTVNVAQRLESAAQPGHILVSAKVARLTGHVFEMAVTEPIRLKGKSEPQEVYDVVALHREEAAPFQMPPLFGRELEIRMLQGWVEQAMASRKGVLVSVSGEAGIGKSRLKVDVEQWLFSKNIACFEGRSARVGEAVSYAPFLGLLSAMLDLNAGMPREQLRSRLLEHAQAMNFAPVQCHALGHLFGLAFEEDAFVRLDEKGRKTATFLAIRQVILHVLEKGLCVMILEDLQWVDALSVELLEFLFPLVETHPVVIFCFHRPAFTRGWEKHAFYQRIHLKELSADAVSALAEYHARTTLPEHIKRIVWERTQGNPLFTEELVRTLREEYPDFATRSQSQLEAFMAERIPENVQGIIAARMDRLSSEAKFILQAASVVGRVVPCALLVKILPPGIAVEEQLQALIDRGFLYEHMEARERELVFKHTFIQDVAYRMLLQKHRQELHRTIAKAVEELFAEHLEDQHERLAFHYQEGGLSQQAAPHWYEAGRKAQAQFDNERAMECYRKGFHLLESMNTAETDIPKWTVLRVSSLLGIAQTARLIAQYDSAMDALKKTEEIFKRFSDVQLQARFHEIYAMVLYFMGRFTEALEQGNKGIEVAGKNGLETNVANCRQALAAAYYGLGNLVQGQRELEQALEIYERYNETSRVAAALSNLGVIYTDQSDYETALARMSRALELFNQLGDKLQLASCYNNLGSLYRYREEFEDAEEYFQQSMLLAQETGSSYGVMRNLLDLSEIYLYQQRSEEALPLLAKVREFAEKQSHKVFLADAAVLAGVAHAQMGDEGAVRGVEEAMCMAEAIPKPMDVLYGKFYLGRLQKERGNFFEARKYLEEARTLAVNLRMKYFEKRIEEALAGLQ